MRRSQELWHAPAGATLQDWMLQAGDGSSNWPCYGELTGFYKSHEETNGLLT